MSSSLHFLLKRVCTIVVTIQYQKSWSPSWPDHRNNKESETVHERLQSSTQSRTHGTKERPRHFPPTRFENARLHRAGRGNPPPAPVTPSLSLSRILTKRRPTLAERPRLLIFGFAARETTTTTTDGNEERRAECNAGHRLFGRRRRPHQPSAPEEFVAMREMHGRRRNECGAALSILACGWRCWDGPWCLSEGFPPPVRSRSAAPSGLGVLEDDRSAEMGFGATGRLRLGFEFVGIR